MARRDSVRRELSAVDRAIYFAVAATPTPSLDDPLRRLSAIGVTSALVNLAVKSA